MVWGADNIRPITQGKAKRIIEQFAESTREKEDINARRLISRLAAVPGPIDAALRLAVQEILVPEATEDDVRLAMQSPIFFQVDGADETARYEFIDGAREVLLNSLPVPEAHCAFDTAAEILEQRYPNDHDTFFNLSIGNFDDIKLTDATINSAKVAWEIWSRTASFQRKPVSSIEILREKLLAYDNPATV